MTLAVRLRIQMTKTTSESDQAEGTSEVTVEGKVCAICKGASGRPLRGKRCTADRCKKAYSALRKAPGDSESVAFSSDRGGKASNSTPAQKVQRTSEQVLHVPRMLNLARIARAQNAELSVSC